MAAADALLDAAAAVRAADASSSSSAAAKVVPLASEAVLPSSSTSSSSSSSSSSSPSSVPAVVQLYSAAAHGHLVLYLAALHGARITSDSLSGSFAPPLDHTRLLDWWRERLATTAVFLLLRTPPPPPPAKATGADLVGVLMLRGHPAETSPHVAAVELLLVNLQYRQLGGERLLMQAVEQQARRDGRTLLTAEAEAGSSTAAAFAALGFTEAGRIPGMVLRPLTGELRAQVLFYKDLTRL